MQDLIPVLEASSAGQWIQCSARTFRLEVLQNPHLRGRHWKELSVTLDVRLDVSHAGRPQLALGQAANWNLTKHMANLLAVARRATQDAQPGRAAGCGGICDDTMNRDDVACAIHECSTGALRGAGAGEFDAFLEPGASARGRLQVWQAEGPEGPEGGSGRCMFFESALGRCRAAEGEMMRWNSSIFAKPNNIRLSDVLCTDRDGDA